MKKYQMVKGFLLLGVLLVGGFPFVEANNSQTPIASQSPFANKIENFLLQDELVKSSMVGISLRDSQTGEVIYEKNGEIPFRPASNLKMITAALALDVLGEDYTFRTMLKTDGEISRGSLKGDLYLVGRGDVTLRPSDLEKFAKALSERGVHTIEGNLIGDDHWYDDVRYSKDLVWEDEETYYGAQISALTLSPTKDYDAGTIIVDVFPGERVGDSPKFSLFPSTDYIKVINNASTVKKGNENTITIHRKHGENTIEISGKIPADEGRSREWVSVWDPTKYTTFVFKEILQKHGISVEGEIKTGIVPKDSKTLYESQSIPLKELLIPFMKLSNNGHAETFVKEMGKVEKGEGSWESGLEVVDDWLTKMELDTNIIQLRDGSGLSQANLIPPNEITNFLFHIQDKTWFTEFRNSLPIAGNPDRMLGGTLRFRMNDLPPDFMVLAKTGTLTTVSSLSGYIEVSNGKSIIFSIMVNNVVDEDEAKEFEDLFLQFLISDWQRDT